MSIIDSLEKTLEDLRLRALYTEDDEQRKLNIIRIEKYLSDYIHWR